MKIQSCKAEDAITLRNLAKKCAPLDVHTPYTYWVVCHMFGEGCFLLLDNDIPVGYITTIIKENSLFIWQIGLVENYRGKNHSVTLLDAVTDYARRNNCTHMFVSIAPDNNNSYYAFHRYCYHHELNIVQNGDVNLYDSTENFEEYEKIYEISL